MSIDTINLPLYLDNQSVPNNKIDNSDSIKEYPLRPKINRSHLVFVETQKQFNPVSSPVSMFKNYLITARFKEKQKQQLYSEEY